ncbi:hypothetical protein FIU86_11620 [Roseovarius sp. THAF9]|uniref:hypothetical protein n=1 Tax=Roseovarius sp. THAF9 TaxID=2587847 RepID=UPI00126850BC|nr:hypothetical protein [Roseovarius sp. THAF9]QFT93491.1 hypothetical protein FIU86_11620 [Roseovarius sp. THAF9]
MISRVRDAFASIPPMRAETLLPLVIMLILWIGLNATGMPEDRVFVLVLVLAQAHAVWRSLPNAAIHLNDGNRARMVWPVVIVTGLSALQLGINDPLFSQRLLSGACVFVLLVMLMGVRREREVMARITHSVTEGRPVSLLRINAWFALVFLCVNEALIATGSLVVWMSAMMIAAFLVHAAYWFIVLLVMPPEDSLA